LTYCQERGILYIDTAVYPWGGDYSKTFECWEICNYVFRRQLHEKLANNTFKTTAICSCGANPGMVSWLVKKALINLAKDTGFPLEK
jgi:homospermidine synthase